METFDRDGDDELEPRERKEREDVFASLDRNTDQRLERAEVERILAVVGIDALAHDFLGRWDLDGDGAVGEGELLEGARVRLK